MEITPTQGTQQVSSGSASYRTYRTDSNYGGRDDDPQPEPPESPDKVENAAEGLPDTVQAHEAVCEQCGSPEGPLLCPHCTAPTLPPPAPPPPLTEWDVGALILNKMIGSGIFTTPPLVLLYTGSGGIALGLWIGGFVYTILR